MWTRREFLRTAGLAGSATIATFKANGVARVLAASPALGDRSPEEVAQDETYWREIQQAFSLDRTIVDLNSGAVSPSPRVVHEAYKRYLDFSNQAPVYDMWTILEPNVETVRRRLAAEFGCSARELAITRNATEALQIVQLGIDLKAGDEVVTTNQDYGRLLTTWEQRAQRDRLRVVALSFPVPAPSLADLYQRFERAITPRTRVLHFSHLTNLTGQLFPVTELCQMARRRGIQTIVDGAHAVAHFPVTLRDLGCDYYGTSLHKWLLAPIGTGFLYVRRPNIAKVWPLQPAPASMRTDIRKFEEIGTHPAAGHNAIAEALTFHQAIGVERKAARLKHLKDRWATRLTGQPRVKMLTSLDPQQPGGLAAVAIDGLDPRRVAAHLWDRHRIVVAPVAHAEFQGIRVTPNVYTTLEEIDTFTGAMEEIVSSGLPGTA